MEFPSQIVNVLHLVDRGDGCALSMLIALLALAGGAMVGGKPSLHLWGKRIAAGAFVVYLAYGAVRFSPETGEDWIRVAFRGILAAGLALGVGWIALAVGDVFYRLLLKGPLDRVRNARGLRRARQQEEQDRIKEQERRRYREQREREKERRQELAEAEARERAAAEEEARKRREEARLDCQLFYDRHAEQLQKRFPRERLEEYFTQYLGDERPPEEVERRAELLKQMLEEHLQGAGGQFKNLAEVEAHFRQRRREIEEAGYDQETKETQLTFLARQEDEILRRFFAS